MMPRDLFLLALAGFMGVSPVLAQVPDPTRPPDSLLTPDGGALAVPHESGVQTVILRPGGRKSAAVINGQYVEVGGMVGGKRVLKITESEVVLNGESGREVIKVMPAIEKVPAKKATAAKRRMTGTTAGTTEK
jgi:hypothetical protein